jgi:hypothetical protein
LQGADVEKVLAYSVLTGSGFISALEELNLKAQGRWTEEIDDEVGELIK